jgi:hypothetical protein
MIPSIFYVARPSTSSKGKALVAQSVFVSNLDFVPRNLLSAVLSMVEEMNARKLPPQQQKIHLSYICEIPAWSRTRSNENRPAVKLWLSSS